MDLSLWLVVLLHLWHWTVELLVELHHSLVLALDETIVDFVGHVSERDLVDSIGGRQAADHRVLVNCDEVTQDRLHPEEHKDVEKPDSYPHVGLLHLVQSSLGKALPDKPIENVQVDADANHAKTPVPLVQ